MTEVVHIVVESRLASLLITEIVHTVFVYVVFFIKRDVMIFCCFVGSVDSVVRL